jgi:acid phosphatase (class A)
MNRRLRAALLSLACVVAAGVLHAAEPVPSFPDYLAVDAVDYRAIIPPPPAEDSFQLRVDEECVLAFARERTPEQARLAKRYETLSVFLFLPPVLGDWATPEALPVTAKVFEQIRRAGRPAIEAAKASWNRRRPYDRFPDRIEPAVAKPHNTSYPSGHSADSAIYAAVLTELFPEQAAAWQEQAARVRWSRLVGGAHYPSDVVAGQLLGAAIARAMLQSPRLKQDLDAVRAELQAARNAHPRPAA